MNRLSTRPLRPYFTIKTALICLILLAFWLRLHNIDTFSFWTDEGLTPLRSSYTLAEILSNRVTIQRGVTNDTHPPFFFLIIHFTRQIFGETDFAYRFPAALAGILLLPVMFQMGRRLQNRWSGVTAVLLTAINPLYIWYSNEARMYTLFVLLMLIAAYALWRALTLPHPHASFAKYLILYLIFAGLALYTHYTAVFIIAVQAPFWGWLLWKRGQKRLILGMVGLAILAAIPLVPYTIPRLFQDVEANYYYVQPLIMVQDVFRFFALGTVVDYKQPLIQIIVWGTALLLLVGVWSARNWQTRSFLLTYLFAAVFGLMVGSYIFKPMYQGVRHIMAGSPAFILLVSLGINASWQQLFTTRTITRPLLLRSVLAVAATAVPLTGAAVAINNLFNNPHYEKDHLRQLIRFVENQAGANDVIVYNNAILLPLHAHYQRRSDIIVTASPVYPTYAEKTSAAQLENLVAKFDRIWFITDPPADLRDRIQFVKRWLDEHTVLMDDYPFWARSTVVGAILYDTQAQFVEALPETAVSQTHQWPKTPSMHGFELKTNEPIDTPAFWFDIYWQGAPPQDTWLRYQLLDQTGHIWGLSEQALIPESDTPPAWPNDGLIRFSYPIRLPLGIPPGTYSLTLQPYDDNGTGDMQTITSIEIADSSSWMHVAERPYTNRSSIAFENGVTLQGVELAADEVRPGHALPLTLYWQSKTDPQQLVYRLTVQQPSGEILTETGGPLQPEWLQSWPTDSLMRLPAGLHMPPEAEPGRYRLTWELVDGETAVAGRLFWQPWRSESITLGAIEVVPWPLETTLPADAQRIEAQFGESILLYGYTLNETDNINLTLYWQASAIPTQNYTVFVHVVDESGQIVHQRDIIPVDGLRPTRGWRVNEVLTDIHRLTLPETLPNGTYTIRIGLYEPDSFARPLVVYQGEPQADNQLELTTIARP